jgi:hypothetical protein
MIADDADGSVDCQDPYESDCTMVFMLFIDMSLHKEYVIQVVNCLVVYFLCFGILHPIF